MLCSKLEADLLSEYGVDLLDLFREEKPLTVRRVITLLDQLPEGSRVAKHIRDDALDTTQHLLLTILDGVNQLNYSSYYNASAQVGKKWGQIWKKAPKPIDRPKIKPPEKKVKRFMSGRELTGGALASATGKFVIEHTEACVKYRTVTGKMDTENCGCPKIEIKKKRPAQ